jgi:hypothetical protein
MASGVLRSSRIAASNLSKSSAASLSDSSEESVEPAI